MLKSISAFGLVSVLAVSLFSCNSVVSNSTSSQETAFRNVFIRISSGQDVTIAQSGPLKLIARCEAGSSPVEILLTSSEGGWFSNSGPLDAGVEILICSEAGGSGSFSQCGDGSALSSGGHYIGVSGALSVGEDILGSDCIVVGPVTTTFEG